MIDKPCTQCPHDVGDITERDCDFPDCVGGWEKAFHWMVDVNAKNVETIKTLLPKIAEKRPVIIFEWVIEKGSQDKFGNRKWIKKEKSCGLFIGIGCDYEEFESGPGNYSTGIIEMSDGTIEQYAIELIKFVD